MAKTQEGSAPTDKEKLDTILAHCVSRMPTDKEATTRYGLGMADGLLDVINLIRPTKEDMAKAKAAAKKLPKETE